MNLKKLQIKINLFTYFLQVLRFDRQEAIDYG